MAANSNSDKPGGAGLKIRLGLRARLTLITLALLGTILVISISVAVRKEETSVMARADSGALKALAVMEHAGSEYYLERIQFQLFERRSRIHNKLKYSGVKIPEKKPEGFFGKLTQVFSKDKGAQYYGRYYYPAGYRTKPTTEEQERFGEYSSWYQYSNAELDRWYFFENRMSSVEKNIAGSAYQLEYKSYYLNPPYKGSKKAVRLYPLPFRYNHWADVERDAVPLRIHQSFSPPGKKSGAAEKKPFLFFQSGPDPEQNRVLSRAAFIDFEPPLLKTSQALYLLFATGAARDPSRDPATAIHPDTRREYGWLLRQRSKPWFQEFLRQEKNLNQQLDRHHKLLVKREDQLIALAKKNGTYDANTYRDYYQDPEWKKLYANFEGLWKARRDLLRELLIGPALKLKGKKPALALEKRLATLATATGGESAQLSGEFGNNLLLSWARVEGRRLLRLETQIGARLEEMKKREKDLAKELKTAGLWEKVQAADKPGGGENGAPNPAGTAKAKNPDQKGEPDPEPAGEEPAVAENPLEEEWHRTRDEKRRQKDLLNKIRREKTIRLRSLKELVLNLVAGPPYKPGSKWRQSKKSLYEFDHTLQLYLLPDAWTRSVDMSRASREVMARGIFQRAEDSLNRLYIGVVSTRMNISRQNEILAGRKNWWYDFGFGILLRGAFLGFFVAAGFVRRMKDIARQTDAVGRGDLSVRFPVESSDEVGLLATRLNQMVAGLREREELRGEIQAAAEIQKRLIPETFPEQFGDKIQFAGFYKPMIGVGGDYYDAFYLPRADRLAVVIADVSNHGIGPAIIMTQMRSYLRALAETESDPRELLLSLNQKIFEETPDDIFITMFLGIVDPKNNRLEYVCGGHNEGLLCRADGTVTELKKGGMPLGIVDSEDLSPVAKVYKEDLRPGDFFLHYTDGLTEAMDASDRQFGLARVKKILERVRDKETATVLRLLILNLEKFTGKEILNRPDSPLEDDIALIGFRVS